MKRVESRLLPPGVKPMGSHSTRRAPHCEKCGARSRTGSTTTTVSSWTCSTCLRRSRHDYDRYPVDAALYERVLDGWGKVDAMRDDLVRLAYAAGVSKNRIYTLTGIARTTIDRILADGLATPCFCGDPHCPGAHYLGGA